MLNPHSKQIGTLENAEISSTTTKTITKSSTVMTNGDFTAAPTANGKPANSGWLPCNSFNSSQSGILNALQTIPTGLPPRPTTFPPSLSVEALISHGIPLFAPKPRRESRVRSRTHSFSEETDENEYSLDELTVWRQEVIAKANAALQSETGESSTQSSIASSQQHKAQFSQGLQSMQESSDQKSQYQTNGLPTGAGRDEKLKRRRVRFVDSPEVIGYGAEEEDLMTAANIQSPESLHRAVVESSGALTFPHPISIPIPPLVANGAICSDKTEVISGSDDLQCGSLPSDSTLIMLGSMSLDDDFPFSETSARIKDIDGVKSRSRLSLLRTERDRIDKKSVSL